ncbi:NAD(P)/FAD-dependent oxidoreductase [Salipiger mangrovisoli]|uniref:NAD(P)/FAD-dependent oxidoreductase n=1 Tax=Salipiger mangrovisoli TaxID=2865933 RepID=UPI001F11FEBB|nr:NAD(P)/FAD-dependent oxidoreductase [Salipiger mangrovisoli]
MTHVVVLGAGFAGALMAHELRERLGPDHQIGVVSTGSSYSVLPSNPWVALGWRNPSDIEVDLAGPRERRDIRLYPEGAARMHLAESIMGFFGGACGACEFTFIVDTAPRRAKARDRVPMTFVTSEPCIGHLGLDGVSDTRGLLEGEMRNHPMKWITHARVVAQPQIPPRGVDWASSGKWVHSAKIVF